MERFLLCPVCLTKYDKNFIKKSLGDYSCPNVKCVGNNTYTLDDPDDVMLPIYLELRKKGYYIKGHKVCTKSGLLSRDRSTIVEFLPEAGLPETCPDGFINDGNKIKSIMPEDDNHTNYLSLLNWCKTLPHNNDEDPCNFPEDFNNFYKLR